GYLVDLSGDGLLAYTPADNPGLLVLRDIGTRAETEMSDRRVGAWGPGDFEAPIRGPIIFPPASPTPKPPNS
ncbi:MAG: hypothetical protein ACRD2A_26545, partial [Vicinamibacterales bacterium]